VEGKGGKGKGVGKRKRKGKKVQERGGEENMEGRPQIQISG